MPLQCLNVLLFTWRQIENCQLLFVHVHVYRRDQLSVYCTEAFLCAYTGLYTVLWSMHELGIDTVINYKHSLGNHIISYFNKFLGGQNFSQCWHSNYFSKRLPLQNILFTSRFKEHPHEMEVFYAIGQKGQNLSLKFGLFWIIWYKINCCTVVGIK